MASVPHEFVTVDMRGMKGALVERSRADRVSVSSLVRDFVASGLGGGRTGELRETSQVLGSITRVRLSIRASAAEAERFAEGARQAGLSRGAYLAELIAGAPAGMTSAARSEQVALLAATNAELSTLSRNVRHLATLLSRGSGDAAKAYVVMLHTIAADVRRHLSVAASVLAEVRTRGVSGRDAKWASEPASGSGRG